jgi:flagellar protein FliJ
VAKFKFRLATVRKMRTAQRDELRAKLAAAYQAEQMLQSQQTVVATELATLQLTQRMALAKSVPDMNTLIDVQRYQAVLRGQQATLTRQSEMLAAETDRRRQAVVEADRQVRVLDKLEERQRDKHRLGQQRLEAKELDEVALQRREVV